MPIRVTDQNRWLEQPRPLALASVECTETLSWRECAVTISSPGTKRGLPGWISRALFVCMAALPALPVRGWTADIAVVYGSCQSWLRKWCGAFSLLLLFIAAVSVHDAALVVLNHEMILEYEQNPVGRWLIEVNGGTVWPFAGVKLFCTAMVCALLVTLYERYRRMGFAAASGLACFQAGLLLYLCSH